MTSKLTAVGLRHEIAAVDAPTQEQRRNLQVRVSTLDHWLRPAGDSALDEITAIFLMSARTVDTGDAKARMRLYLKDLADVPFFALAQACAAFRQGRAGDGWRPSQADIRKQADVYAQPFRAERLKISQVLAATVVDIRDNPERRKAIADKLRAVARSISVEGRRAEALRAGRPLDAEITAVEQPETPEARLMRLKGEYAAVPAAVLSPKLRRSAQAAQGIDPEQWEDEQRMRDSFDEQGGFAA